MKTTNKIPSIPKLRDNGNFVFIVNRRGSFRSSDKSPNKCRTVEHRDFYYHVKVACRQLDENAFIIDHNTINDTIKKLRLKGSCEQFCIQIFNAIEKRMEENSIIAFKIKIRPTPFEKEMIGTDESFIEFEWHNQYSGIRKEFSKVSPITF